MPTAIREVALSSPFSTLDRLGAYDRCMLVFRWGRRVVGRSFVDVVHGRVSEADVAQSARGLGRAPALVWLADTLGYDECATTTPSALTATIAICTRERPDDLARALEGVLRQTRSGHDVIVIDNAPDSSRTREVVARFPSARYVCEPRRGLNAARNRAVQEAAGDVVAFTDDDAVPEAEWLDALLANFSDPRVQCVTGLTLPSELETPAQELFEQVSPFARGFVRRTFDGQHDNPFEVGRVGAGANMAIRRSVLETIGPFDERLDGGMPTRSGGDHEMFVRILSAGHRIVYEPGAVSWHRHRRTHAELVDTIYGYGVGVYSMWSGLVVERREIGVVRLAWAWFKAAHLPELRRMMRRRPPTPASELARAELRGCLHGPRAWLAARRLRPTGAPP